MRRLSVMSYAFVAAIAALFAISFHPAAAQQQPPDTPRAVLGLALSGEDGHQALSDYLTGAGDPAGVAGRARQLLEALEARKSDLPPEAVYQAINAVSNLAVRAISSTPIVQLAIENGFEPRDAVMALDFGPPDADVMAGFERVVPDDPRLQGEKASGLRRPADNPLLSDGITGLRKIRLEVPDGRYRLVLMTQDLADPVYSTQPFGREVRINGVPVLIDGNRPALWAREAILASPDGVRRASERLRRDGAYLTGEVGDSFADLKARQRAGAIILEGTARGGVLELEMRGFARLNSYVTGMLVERAEAPSSIILSAAARRRIVADTERVALETDILAVAARAAEGITPPQEPEFGKERKTTDN